MGESERGYDGGSKTWMISPALGAAMWMPSTSLSLATWSTILAMQVVPSWFS